MIKKLNFSDSAILSRAFELQKAAYSIEAALIGSQKIPPLQENIKQLKNSKEDFFGFFSEGRLVGFIAIEQEPPYLRISRLVVSPTHFKKGIGQALIQLVLSEKDQNQQVIVSTGKANTPARSLYEKLDFKLIQNFEVDGIQLVEYVR